MNSELIFLLVISLAAGLIVYAIAANKRGSTTDFVDINSGLTLKSDLSPGKLLKIVSRYAIQSGYRIDSIDENKYKIVLSDPTTFNHNGFIYYISIINRENSTVLHINNSTKFGGYLGKKSSLERCYNGIKALMFAYSD